MRRRKKKGKVLMRRPRGRSLGISETDSAQLIRQVRAGFTFTQLERFQRVSGLSWERIARSAGIPKRTLNRRKAEGRLRPDESDRVLRISTIVDMAVDLFEGDADAARRWLETPQPGLGGEVPLEFAVTEVGAREVEHLIVRLEHGVFA